MLHSPSLYEKDHIVEIIPFQVPPPSIHQHVAPAAELVERDQNKNEWTCKWENCSKSFHSEQEMSLNSQSSKQQQLTFKSQQELIIHLEKHLELKTFKCGWFGCWNDIQYSSKAKLIGNLLF
jgi:hypothetical protein